MSRDTNANGSLEDAGDYADAYVYDLVGNRLSKGHNAYGYPLGQPQV